MGMMKLEDLLFNILTANLSVWIWAENGHCIYVGDRMGALKKYGRCTVAGWRMNGAEFRANILTGEVKGDG